MHGYASCRSNGEVVHEGVCKSVCALGWVMCGGDVKCAPGVDREGCVVSKLGIWTTDGVCMIVARRSGSKGFEVDRHE